MVRQNRRDIFDPYEVGAYHACQRTVRRAWLCGQDPVSGNSFEHRRAWIQTRLKELSACFGLDCLSFAVMVNHIHVVVRNRPDVVAAWTDEQVALRWWQLFPSRKNKDKTPTVPTQDELKMLMSPARSKELRTRLSDISWWMRALAEPIARQSNAEDKCTGRFWQGRFKCQKLADESAILACSAYVDLNPVRAGVAEVPEKSRYTSVYERVQAEKAYCSEKVRAKIRNRQQARNRSKSGKESGQTAYVRSDEWLSPVTVDERSVAYQGPMPNKTGKRASDKGFLGMSFEMYLKLLDWTGRQIRLGKKGQIPKDLAPILDRIGLSGELWCDVVSRFGKIFKRVAGTPESLAKEAIRKGQSAYRTNGSPFPGGT